MDEVVELHGKFEPSVRDFLIEHKQFEEMTNITLALNFTKFSKIKFRGIGEIGLDRTIDVDYDKQLTMFKDQIEVAERFKRPVIIHNVKADEDIYRILKSSKVKGIFHSYSSPASYAKNYVDLGFYFSFSPRIMGKSPEKVREIIKNIPIEKILVESDSPYIPKDASTKSFYTYDDVFGDPEDFGEDLTKYSTFKMEYLFKFLANCLEMETEEFVNQTIINSNNAIRFL